MRIGILTYYGVHNYGAVLQANALMTVLKSKGCECGFLEFERSYSNISEKQANKYKIGLGSIPFYAKYILNKGLANILFNYKKRTLLNAFRKDHLPFLGKYDEFSGDLTVIGSDEVFSLEIGVNPFLYGNGLNSDHVISYAASFGPTTYENIINQNQNTMISNGLKSMNSVSVRDLNSKEIVKIVSGIDAAVVCDPVILYGYEKEMDEYIPPIKGYILIYSYDKNMNDPAEYNYIKAYASEKGLKIVSLGNHHKWCKNISAAPIELLGWIKHADLVVTDTFHGSVLSIICNTPMVVKLRGNQNKLQYLLNEYGLAERIIPDFSVFPSVAEQSIDFDKVNDLVREHRTSSMNFLDAALSECVQKR